MDYACPECNQRLLVFETKSRDGVTNYKYKVLCYYCGLLNHIDKLDKLKEFKEDVY